MKTINKILLIFFCLMFISCENSIQLYSSNESRGKSYSSEDPDCTDYEGDIDYYADSKGIHISIPLEEHKINKIVLYEIQGSTEIEMAKVKPVSRLYNYALDGSPCGEIMYEVKGEDKTEKRAYYRTNYLEGTINLDLNFVEPGKNYHFLLCLDEPEIESGGGGTYYSSSNSSNSDYEEKPRVRYCKAFSQRAADEVFYSDFIKASYNSETDKFTVNPLDVKTLGLPFEIKDYSDISLSASALYKDTLDSKRTPLAVPLAINPLLATETSLSVIAENIEDADFGADYALSSISGSLQFKDHLDSQINESSTADEKKTYYAQLYSQKVYSYNCPYINCPSVPAVVNFPDKRMNVTVTPEADDNLLSFTLLTDATVINVYRKSAEEKEPFLAGTMSGRFVSGETYTFTDYYAESGKSYTYFVRWNGARKSKSVSVTTTSGMKYKPNAPVMTYEYDSEAEEGIFTITTNPFAGKLPENYHGTITFIYVAKILATHGSYNGEAEWEYYYHDVFDMLIKDTDTTYQVYKYDLSYSASYDSEWDGKLIVKEPYFAGQKDEDSNESNSSYSSSINENSYYVTITGQKEGITYRHYYLLKDKGSMPAIDSIREDDGYNSSTDPDEIDISDIALRVGEELYTLKPSVKDDYAKIKNVTQNEDGTVSIQVYLPSWTNHAELRRIVEKTMNNEETEWKGADTEATFYFDLDKHTGDITIIDFDITEGVEYLYDLSADSVEPYNSGIDDETWNGVDFSSKLVAQKSSDYYLTKLPIIKGFNYGDVDGNVGWNKLPQGYSMIDDKHITQKTVSKLDGTIIEGHYVNLQSRNLYKKNYIFNIGYHDNYSSSSGSYYPSVEYKCTEITGEDKYYEDEYGNKKEKVLEEYASVLQYKIGKSIRVEDSYCCSNNWSTDSYYRDRLHGVYELQSVNNMPFICDYGIWIYDYINTDHVTENKTFTKTNVETSEE